MPEHIVKPLVMIESPYEGSTDEEIEYNVKYARLCMSHSLLSGESPFASHLLYTQEGILRDSIPAERKQGIESGYAWGLHADIIAVYTDYGITPGMNNAISYYRAINIPVEFRSFTDTPRTI